MPPSIGTHGGGQHPGPPVGGGAGAEIHNELTHTTNTIDKTIFKFITIN